MPPLQALRIVLGLTMRDRADRHFVATRYAFDRFGLAAEYQRVWAASDRGRQLALLVPGWLHGCLGLNYAFSSRRVWQKLRFVLFGAALLLPVLAALGLVTMGRKLAGPGGVATSAPAAMPPLQRESLADVREGTLAAYAALVGLVVVGRIGRSVAEKRRKATARITYPQRTALVSRPLLELSLPGTRLTFSA